MVAVDRQTEVAVNLSGEIAGKRALQQASAILSERLVRSLLKVPRSSKEGDLEQGRLMLRTAAGMVAFRRSREVLRQLDAGDAIMVEFAEGGDQAVQQ